MELEAGGQSWASRIAFASDAVGLNAGLGLSVASHDSAMVEGHLDLTPLENPVKYGRPTPSTVLNASHEIRKQHKCNYFRHSCVI